MLIYRRIVYNIFVYLTGNCSSNLMQSKQQHTELTIILYSYLLTSRVTRGASEKLKGADAMAS